MPAKMADIETAADLRDAMRSDIRRMREALTLIADGEPPEEEKALGTVDVWMREIARQALGQK
jgi:hypothetical protein